MAYHVIYIPGLGDNMPHGQSIVLNIWRLFGLKTHYFPLGWADKEDFEPKFNRLLAKIDYLVKDGHTVSLVGVSAGASAVLNAYAKNKNIHAVVCVCGKIQNPQTVHDHTYQKNPAFKQSLARVQGSLKEISSKDRKKIMSIHPIEDSTVPVRDTIMPGAVEKQIPVKGHVFSIAYTILFGGRTIAKFVKA